jgi:hypothetical protein
MDKTSVSVIATCIKHYIGSHGQCYKIRNRDKKHNNLEGWKKTHKFVGGAYAHKTPQKNV